MASAMMNNQTLDIDTCKILMRNISESSDRSGYEAIMEIILDMTTSGGDSFSAINIGVAIYLVQFIFIMTKTIVDVAKSLGLGVTVVLTIISYCVYKIVKIYDYVQHDVSPVQYKNKKRDLSNMAMRLKKIGTKLPPPYPNGWLGIMESSELKPGELMQVDCLGENFAVSRTMDGKSHVTDAYCPHLGVSLANGGVIKDGCIECPFHKWRFDADTGKCTSIPNVDTVPRGVGVKVWPSVEVHDTIYVWYDKEGRAPDWDIPIVEEIQNGDWIYHGRNEFFVASHIQDIPENGSDVAHLNAVHSDNLLAGKFLPTTDNWNIFGIHDWSGNWENSDKKYMAFVRLIQKVRFFNRFSLFKLDVEGNQLGPGIVRLRISAFFGELIFIQYVTPLEPLLQKLIHRVYAPWYLRLFAKIIMTAETTMVNRDVVIWNQKSFVNNPQLAKTDKCIKAYRNWFSQFYSPNSIPFKEAILGPKKDLIDW